MTTPEKLDEMRVEIVGSTGDAFELARVLGRVAQAVSAFDTIAVGAALQGELTEDEIADHPDWRLAWLEVGSAVADANLWWSASPFYWHESGIEAFLEEMVMEQDFIALVHKIYLGALDHRISVDKLIDGKLDDRLVGDDDEMTDTPE